MKLINLFENEKRIVTPTKFKNYYIEVCPEEYEIKSIWGPNDIFYNCVSEIDGYKNTVQMYLHQNELADKVLNLVIDGKDDWYIPARDELEHIYQSRIVIANRWFWASTESGPGHCWLQYFINGTMYRTPKSSAHYTRSIRRVYRG